MGASKLFGCCWGIMHIELLCFTLTYNPTSSFCESLLLSVFHISSYFYVVPGTTDLGPQTWAGFVFMNRCDQWLKWEDQDMRVSLAWQGEGRKISLPKGNTTANHQDLPVRRERSKGSTVF